jgi:hypothetical protein
MITTAKLGHVDIVQKLIDKGADLDIQANVSVSLLS